jgi:hypothetical protein
MPQFDDVLTTARDEKMPAVKHYIMGMAEIITRCERHAARVLTFDVSAFERT